MFERLSEWAERRLVPNWRESWKWASVQFAAAISALVGVLIGNADGLLRLIPYVPSGWPRIATIAGFVLFAFIIPWFLRVWKQEARDDR